MGILNHQTEGNVMFQTLYIPKWDVLEKQTSFLDRQKVYIIFREVKF